MKNTKKLFAALTVTGMIFSGAVFAAEDDVMLIQAPAVTEPTATINGATLSGVEAVEINGIPMIPLRSVCESLGFTVNWNGEKQSIDLIKGAQFITMRLGEDAYTFSKQAPRALGSAPVLYNDTTTYVPINFITEILDGVYNLNEDNTYEIINPSIVTVSEVLEDGSLLVQDDWLGEVLVHIADTTVFANDAQITQGATLAIGYDVAMTSSIPPQTTARFIRVENTVEVEPAEEVSFTGTITEIDGELVTVGTPREAGSVCLVITQDTILNGVSSAAELTVGMEVKGTHSTIATFSIPPQSVAFQVEVVK